MTTLLQVQSPGGTWYKIDFDGKTYTVMRLHHTAKGEVTWRNIDGPYFAKLSNACKELLETGLTEQDHQQVMTLIWRMDAWTKRIEDAVKALEARP